MGNNQIGKLLGYIFSVLIMMFIFRYFWWVILIVAVVMLFGYLRINHLAKKAEEEMQKELDDAVSLDQQIFEQSVNQHNQDIIDAEYTVREEGDEE